MKDTFSLDSKVKEVMTDSLISVGPNTLMTDVISIFDENSFHHIPVLDSAEKPVGMISKSDYHKLQHHFTLFKFKDAEQSNVNFFKSLVASDVMNKKPICVGSATTINDAIKMFIVNKFHSLIVVEQEKCVGIITPYDFLGLLQKTL